MKKIILLAGSGDLPKLLIDSFLKKKIDFFSLIFEKNLCSNYVKKYNYKVINFGKIVSELKKLKSLGFCNLVMAGAIKRPSVFDIKPDINSLKLLPSFAKRLIQGGDNNILAYAIKHLEKVGFCVLKLNKLLPECFLGNGNSTKNKISKTVMNDIKKGRKILDNNSKFDIGQSVIIQQGNVIGIEAVEGTDNLIIRSSKFFLNREKATLIKLTKLNQDLRADLPTIGIKTVINCKKYGLGGIAFSAQKTIFLRKDSIIDYCNKKKLFLFGV